jgi:hypothetical protein
VWPGKQASNRPTVIVRVSVGPGHGDEGGGDLLKTGFDVGGGGRSGGVGVSGVGAGDAVAVVAFYPGECGVAEPVGGDALGGDPGEPFAESFPEVVVAAAGQRASIAEPQQGIRGEDGSAGCGVVDQAVRECGGDGLPADGAAFFAESDQAAVWVEVLESDAERAAASACGLGVESEEECVEDGVVAADAGGGVDLVEFPGGECSAGVG